MHCILELGNQLIFYIFIIPDYENNIDWLYI